MIDGNRREPDPAAPRRRVAAKEFIRQEAVVQAIEVTPDNLAGVIDWINALGGYAARPHIMDGARELIRVDTVYPRRRLFTLGPGNILVRDTGSGQLYRTPAPLFWAWHQQRQENEND